MQQLTPTNRQLNQLFRSLSLATHPKAIAQLQECIWTIWSNSGCDKINLALQKGIEASLEKDYNRALRLFSRILWVMPHFSEGYVEQGELAKALRDYEMALILEPRRFDAMFGIAKIRIGIFDENGARKMLQRALWLMPHEATLKQYATQSTSDSSH